jgi:hypothetical protein
MAAVDRVLRSLKGAISVRSGKVLLPFQAAPAQTSSLRQLARLPGVAQHTLIVDGPDRSSLERRFEMTTIVVVALVLLPLVFAAVAALVADKRPRRTRRVRHEAAERPWIAHATT